jgi:hypothetical protein
MLWVLLGALEHTMRNRLSLLATAVTAAVVASAGTAASAAPDDPSAAKPPTALVAGLTSPLHVSAGRDGSVTVSEQFAGRLTRVDSQGNKTVLYENEDWGVAGNAQWHGATYFLESQGPGPGAHELAGHIRIIEEDGKQRTLGDFAELETKHNSDGDQRYGFRDLPADCAARIPADIPVSYKGEVDSHPYGIAVTSRTIYVADAGANSVVSVDARSGETRTLAVLPPRKFKIETAETAKAAGLPECVAGRTYAFEPVPTDVAVGPDGWLYVTSLPGGPEGPELGPRGAIFKVDPDSGRVKLVADEILSPTGLVLDEDGDMYVASLFGDGVVKVDRHSGKQTVVLAAKLTADVDLRNGALYATTNALPGEAAPPDGNVLYVQLRHGSHDSDEDS